VLGGGKYIPKEEPVGSNKVLWFIVLSIIAAAAAAGGWYYLQNKSAKPADTIKKPEVDTSRPFAVEPARRSNSTSPFPEVDEPQETQPEKPDTTTDDQQPPANSGDDSQSTSNPATTESINASAGGNSNTDITSGGDQARSSTTASDTANQDSQPAVEQSPPVIRTSVPAPTTVTNNSSGNASGATSLGGSVPRSRLTSAVRNLEPVDILGPDITYKNSGFTRVFYFTELREFSDGHIIHRWEHNGVVTDEVKLKVQNSWRWRTYSNKDITPGLTGNWKVSVIDSAGREIDAETFTYGYE